MNFIQDMFFSILLSRKSFKQLGNQKLVCFSVLFVFVQTVQVLLNIYCDNIVGLKLLRQYVYGFLKLIFFTGSLWVFYKIAFKKSMLAIFLKGVFAISIFSLFLIPLRFLENAQKIISLLLGIFALIYFYFFVSENVSLEKKEKSMLGVFIILANLVSKFLAFFSMLIFNTICSGKI